MILPGYRRMDRAEYRRRIGRLFRLAFLCRLCPRECGVDRLRGRSGFCRVPLMARVASYGPHPGEESVLRGSRGSGTIFFSGCNLGCVFCQNYDLSHQAHGRPMSVGALARVMLALQSRGCPNINLVSPTHLAHAAFAALYLARKEGLEIPLVYNTGGYDSTELLKALEGLVDIYMPDAKYADPGLGRRLSAAEDYPRVNREALREMYRQVGPLEVDARTGLARRGLLVRHLVLPGHLEDSREIFRFLASLGEGVGVNVMGQYYPAYRAREHPDLARPLRRSEYAQALEEAREVGLQIIT